MLVAYRANIETKFGAFVVIGDEEKIYFLQLKGHQRIQKWPFTIVDGYTKPMRSIEQELNEYFEGNLTTFKTPIALWGTEFQKSVWQELQNIPFGQTVSYSEIAKKINRSKAFRAVANANGANKIAIVIPCHRIINSNGDLGGYAGGVERKEWLIKHEQRNR